LTRLTSLQGECVLYMLFCYKHQLEERNAQTTPSPQTWRSTGKQTATNIRKHNIYIQQTRHTHTHCFCISGHVPAQKSHYTPHNTLHYTTTHYTTLHTAHTLFYTTDAGEGRNEFRVCVCVFCERVCGHIMHVICKWCCFAFVCSVVDKDLLLICNSIIDL